MKILKRTKGLLRFKTTIGTIVLNDGVNELSKEQFETVKAHPMYEAMVKTSGLILVAEETPKTDSQVKREKKEAEKAAKKAEADKKKAEAEEKARLEAEAKEAEKNSDEDDSEGDESDEDESNEEGSEEGIDISEIDLQAQDKKTLVDIAEALEIETKGKNKEQIIELIEAKK